MIAAAPGEQLLVLNNMQWILGLDLSSQPCEVTLSRCEGGEFEVVDRKTLSLPVLLDPVHLASQDLAGLLPSGEGRDAQSSDSTSGNPRTEKIGSDSAPAELSESVLNAVEALRAAQREFEDRYTAAAVILPPVNFLALNLNLPFGDPKNLNRIIDLEVQDVVPFDLDEFLVQYAPLGPLPATGVGSSPENRGAFDVHVGLLPRTFVRNVLGLCKSAGIEPIVMTVPSSAAAAVYHLAKDFFRGDSAVLLCRDNEYSIAFFIDGQVRMEHCLRPDHESVNRGGGREETIRALLTSIRLVIASAERRYACRIETVYVLGRAPRTPLLQQLLGRPVEQLSLGDVVSGTVDQDGISSLGATFAADDAPARPLSNFRTREFSFSPRFGEFVKVLGTSWRYLTAAALSVVIGVAGTYAAREYRVQAARSALVSHIRSVIPEFDENAPNILEALAQEEAKLSSDLGVLGPIAKVTPLDALLQIIELVPADGEAAISQVKVSNRLAQIRGSAPSLTASERLARELRTKGSSFSKTELKPTNAVAGRYNFEIDLTLSQ